MAEVKFQPSLKVESFFSEDLINDSERFLLFLKAYYEWLQTTKITYTGLSGIFERDETIVGSTSGANAIVKEVGTNYIIALVQSRLPFDFAETITGSTSGATALVSTIKENVVRKSGNFLNNRYIETSVDEYQDYLKAELYDSIPKDYLGDKRQIALKFKKYFESRSNEESYRFLFRLLYDEPIEFYYPGEDILRPSDGNFEKTNVIRVAVTDNVFEFLEKTIRGETSDSLANVVDVKSFFVGGIEVAELTLKLVSGSFTAGETIVDINDETLSSTIYGIISSIVINDGGSGYSVGDSITIAGDGSEAEARVSSISDAPISRLIVNDIGHGYRLGSRAVINESGTGGNGLIIEVTSLTNTYSYTDANTSSTYTLGKIDRVQILNRGSGYISTPTVTLQDTTVASFGLLSAELITIEDGGSDYGVGNTLVFTGGSGANATGQVASVEESTSYDFLFEDGFRMLSEDSYYDIIKNEDWQVLGSIARVELANFGDGYETANLPSITVTTTTGSGANLIATNIQGKSANVEVDVANNDVGIGAIRAIEIVDFGINYSSANADASSFGDGNANLTPTISGLGIKDGNWVDDDGKLNYKFIQDSFYYQDFSYVIRSGLAFNFYKDVIKSTIHPAGLQPFGEILISSELSVAPNFISVIDIERYMERIITFLLQAQTSAAVSSTNQYRIEYQTKTEDVVSLNRELQIEYQTSANLVGNFDRELVVSIVPEVSNLQIVSDQTTSVIIETYQPSTVTSYEEGRRSLTFAEVPIAFLASNTIAEYSSNTFNDVIVPATSSIINSKINGTVTLSTSNAHVIGTNTAFTSDFFVGEYFIANNSEKFIINSISNNTFMTLNVNPAANYTDADAYKVIRYFGI